MTFQNTPISRRQAIATAAALAAPTLLQGAHAQSVWPNRPLKIVVGFPAGSTPDLMARFTTDGKPPRSVVLIDVKEAYLHCVKAIKRAGLWTQEAQVDRATFPTAGQVYRDQLKLEIPGEAIDASLEQDARENLY